MRKGIASTTPVDPVDRFAHWVICWGAVLMLLGAWGIGWAATAIAVGALCVVLGAALDVECQIRGMVETTFEFREGAVSGAAAALVEFGTWDEAAKDIYVSVDGERRLHIDLVAKTITYRKPSRHTQRLV